MKPGAYKACAQVVVQLRTAKPSDFEGVLYIGLVTRGPAPEGGRISEIDTPNYRRQPVEFENCTWAGSAGRILKSVETVRFEGVSNWPAVTHLVVFDLNGAAVASGLLVTSPGHAAADTMTFVSTAIQLDLRTPSPDVIR